MHRALFARDAERRVGVLPCLGRTHHGALRGHDDHGDIGHHDGAQHRAEMHIGAAPAEQLRQRPGRHAQQNKQQGHQRCFIARER